MVPLKELKELIALLRESGVTSFKDGDLSLMLGPLPGTPTKTEEEEALSRLPLDLNARLRKAAGEKPKPR